MVVPVFSRCTWPPFWVSIYGNIYICGQVTHLQHTQLLGSAWLPASQISEKLEILETLELCVNAVVMGIQVNSCLCSKPQLLFPTLSSTLSRAPNVPVPMCVQQSSIQAGQGYLGSLWQSWSCSYAVPLPWHKLHSLLGLQFLQAVQL